MVKLLWTSFHQLSWYFSKTIVSARFHFFLLFIDIMLEKKHIKSISNNTHNYTQYRWNHLLLTCCRVLIWIYNSIQYRYCIHFTFTLFHMVNITVLDWLINKPVQLDSSVEIPYSRNTYIVYKDNEWKEYVWELLWYPIKTEKKWTYIRTLTGREETRFEDNKAKAKEYYKTFSVKFKKEFPTSVPITARLNLYGNQIYFYFFAEQRFDFAHLVRELREKIPMRFFIYQVWARDRVRLHEWIHERYDSNWLPLMYSLFKHPLDQVDSDVILDQGLRWRSAERLKDRSWKFDHTLNFEQEIYKEEIPKYPKKWEITVFNWKKVKCFWFNILTQDIKFRWEDSSNPWRFTWEFITATLDEREKDSKELTPSTGENEIRSKRKKRTPRSPRRSSVKPTLKKESWAIKSKRPIRGSGRKRPQARSTSLEKKNDWLIQKQTKIWSSQWKKPSTAL